MLLRRLIWEDTSGATASPQYASGIGAQQCGQPHVSHAKSRAT